MESSVPPGFRFHPNDEELVGYYLKKKVSSLKIDLDVIREIDLYQIEPWDVQERCRIGYEEQIEWYFFSHKDKKYPTGTRTNRATIAGFWKATGRDKAVYDKSTKLIGMRKTLVFYKGRAPNGQKTDWIMHEYRLESNENGPPQEEGWVVCRAFKKRNTNVNVGSSCKLSDQVWESSSTNNYSLYQQPSGYLSSSSHHHFPPTSFLPPPPPSSSHSFPCKQELDHSTNIHPFRQLPQLESPNSALKSSGEINIIEDIDKPSIPLAAEKVTDWRSLDKFVASQLSHHDNDNAHHCNHLGTVSGFGGGHHNDTDTSTTLLDMALLLLQNTAKDRGGDKFINGLFADFTN